MLAGGADDEQSDQGFQGRGNRQSGDSANRQSGDSANRQGEQGASTTDDEQYDQGTARREDG